MRFNWGYSPGPMSSDMPPPPPPPNYGAPPPGYGAPPGYPSGYPGYPPAGYRPTVAYANFWSRFLAFLLDNLIGLLFSVPGLVALFAGPKGDVRTCRINGELRLCRYPSAGTIAVSVVLTSIGVIVFIYLYCKMMGSTGQTWGRKALNIRVLDQQTGQPIGMGRAVGRFFARFLSSFVCYLGFLWMLWDPAKQTWHDKIVGTVVVTA